MVIRITDRDRSKVNLFFKSNRSNTEKNFPMCIKVITQESLTYGISRDQGN